MSQARRTQANICGEGTGYHSDHSDLSSISSASSLESKMLKLGLMPVRTCDKIIGSAYVLKFTTLAGQDGFCCACQVCGFLEY